jgi:hypothetical protein
MAAICQRDDFCPLGHWTVSAKTSEFEICYNFSIEALFLTC